MAIPTFDQLVHPLLVILEKQAGPVHCKQVYTEMVQVLELTDEEQRQLLPSKQQPTYQNRTGWAMDRLKRAELTDAPRRGYWQITDKGRAFLNEHPDHLDDESLRSLITYTPLQPDDDQPPVVPPPGGETQSPEERIDTAIRELHDSLSVELLDQIGQCPPAFFEQLVLDVLLAMGYGASRADLEATPLSGDGGIDGIITLDRLGLEKVYVQAKRWTKGCVGRPEIQKFFGALAGRRANRGVFITTSTFTGEAREYARQVSDSIVLVDGKELAALMIEYGVGVSVQRTIKIARLDSDYFEEG